MSHLVQSKRLNPSTFKLYAKKYPFLAFGAPFLITIVGASFALSHLTQTRYDLRDEKVSAVTKEQELHMKKDRRKLDVREEYFRLQGGGRLGEDDWEIKRVGRLPGQAEWGELPVSKDSKSKAWLFWFLTFIIFDMTSEIQPAASTTMPTASVSPPRGAVGLGSGTSQDRTGRSSSVVRDGIKRLFSASKERSTSRGRSGAVVPDSKVGDEKARSKSRLGERIEQMIVGDKDEPRGAAGHF